MVVSFPHRHLRSPKLLKEIMIGGRLIQTFPPGVVELSIKEKQQIEELAKQAARKANIPMPPLIRIDGILYRGGFKVFEINSDHPVGLGFLLNVFSAYGCRREVSRIKNEFSHVFRKKTVVFIQEQDAKFSVHEIPALQRYFPNSLSCTLESGQWKQYAREKNYYLVRTSGKNYYRWYTHWPVESMNPPKSWNMGMKTILASLSSPLLIPCKILRTARSITVPKNIVAKAPHGRHGEKVFFPGEIIKKGTYLLQTQLPIPRHAFFGTYYHWGIDFFLLHGKLIAAFGRTCHLGEKKLNVGAGGGLFGYELRMN